MLKDRHRERKEILLPLHLKLKSLAGRKIGKKNIALVLPLSVILLFIIFGVNQSSLNFFNQGTKSTSLIQGDWSSFSIGPYRSVRSDEFLRSTPYALSALRNSGNVPQTQLSVDSNLLYRVPSSLIDKFLNPELSSLYAISRYIPLKNTFSFLWWQPFILFLVGFWVFCVSLKIDRQFFLPFSLLFIFSPSASWWSFIILPILGNAFISSGVLILAAQFLENQKKLLASFLIATSAFFTARLLYCYTPWVIVVGGSLIATTLILLLLSNKAIISASTLILYSVLSTILLTIFYQTHKVTLDSLSHTVYPGQRKVGGGSLSLMSFFQGPFLGINQFNPGLNSSNYSELSTGFFVFGFLIWCTSLFIFLDSRNFIGINIASFSLIAGTFGFFWTIWATFDFGPLGASIPIINRVPDFRVFGVASFLFLLPVMGMLSGGDSLSKRIQFFLPFTAFLCTFMSGIQFSRYLQNGIQLRYILICSLSVAFIQFFLASETYRRKGIWLFAIMTLFSSALVNPVNRGLGELDGDFVHTVRELSATNEFSAGRFWAGDSLVINALLLGSGVPVATGQQMSGPNVSKWKIFDPNEQYRDVWNRGASYINFNFKSGSRGLLSNLNGDVVLLEVDPCAPSLSNLDISFLVTDKELQGVCITKIIDSTVMGMKYSIYKIRN